MDFKIYRFEHKSWEAGSPNWDKKLIKMENPEW